jgi:hypothetical protein
MNMKNHPLDRLLRSARQACLESPAPVVAWTEAQSTRVLAEWREQARRGEFGTLHILWRWGVASAFGLALAVLTASFLAHPLEDSDGDPFLVTDRAITLAVHSAWLP